MSNDSHRWRHLNKCNVNVCLPASSDSLSSSLSESILTCLGGPTAAVCVANNDLPPSADSDLCSSLTVDLIKCGTVFLPADLPPSLRGLALCGPCCSLCASTASPTAPTLISSSASKWLYDCRSLVSSLTSLVGVILGASSFSRGPCVFVYTVNS